MNSMRLFVLGTLSRRGPMHGHQLRKIAQHERIDLWASIKVGSLYGALRRMNNHGAIEAIYTEQPGNRPERTIYAITEVGLTELKAHRSAALSAPRLQPEPIDLALQFLDGLTLSEVRTLLTQRRRVLADQLAGWRRKQEALQAYLRPVEEIAFRHTTLRLEAEITWHDELLRRLPELMH